MTYGYVMKAFNNPKILKIAKKIAKRDLCNSCLGRQFAHVSTGMTNLERGKIIRTLIKSKESKSCSLCDNIFSVLERYAQDALAKINGLQFSSFVVGTKLSRDLLLREENFWEEVGIEYCEPLKSELNRELGKLLCKKFDKKVDELNPDIVILLNLEKKEIEIHIHPLFIYGVYQKLIRGIPQTKWETYKETVEDIIAKPFMEETQATAHAFHGAGREDIDARCLDWRPFVFELENPRKRDIPLSKMQKEINNSKKVKVAQLRFSSKKEVREVKAMRPDKSYRALVAFEKEIKEQDLNALKRLVGIIQQKTPSRVLHRRADLLRKRRVKEISAKLLSDKKALIEVRGEAGLYIKELVSGDGGRTVPSVAQMLGPAKVAELDVIKIHRVKSAYESK